MIYKVIDNLNKLKISEDGIFDDNEKRILKDSIASFRVSFDELKKLGVYESSKTKIVRDNVAECLRKHAIDLGNNLKEDQEALNLNDFMELVAGTDGLKNMLGQESKIIKENLKIQTNPTLTFSLISMNLLLKMGNYIKLQQFLRGIKEPEVLSFLVEVLNREYGLDFINGRLVYKKGTMGQGCFPIVLLGLFFMFAIFLVF